MNVHISPEKECLRYAEKRINDVDLYYEVHGKGSALMLVAGLGSDSQSWVPNVQDLAQHYQVIIFDNRGTGRTVPHETETSIQQMSDDCVALIKALGLSSVALLGHSMAVLKTIPGSTSAIIQDAAHSIHMEQSKAFNDHIIQFLGSAYSTSQQEVDAL
jgi:pimeloyl-ACP methyl ester carboxylesterase